MVCRASCMLCMAVAAQLWDLLSTTAAVYIIIFTQPYCTSSLKSLITSQVSTLVYPCRPRELCYCRCCVYSHFLTYKEQQQLGLPKIRSLADPLHGRRYTIQYVMAGGTDCPSQYLSSPTLPPLSSRGRAGWLQIRWWRLKQMPLKKARAKKLC